MTNVDTAHLALIDQRFTQPQPVNGVVTLPSQQAYQQYEWVRPYFDHEPEYGYFIWVKEQPATLVTLCALIETSHFQQKLANLLVVEPGIEAEMGASCEVAVPNVPGEHHARGTLILKAGSSLKYHHSHSWGLQNKVSTNYKFHLESKSCLQYNYQSQQPSLHNELNNQVYLAADAKAQVNVSARVKEASLTINEKFFLQGEGAEAVSRLRLVAEENSKIKADSQLIAQAAGKGHLDCQGLNLADSAQLELIPSLLDEDSGAELTHEAAVGKIAADKLHYLRSRGLSEDQAINLIVTGFLSEAIAKNIM